MPQLDSSVFLTQLFWLALTFVPLYLILWKMVLPRIGDVLEARQDHIDADLGKATALRNEAEAVLAEYEKALAETRDKATAAIKQAGDEVALESARRHESFGQELAENAKAAEQRISAAKLAALGNIKAVAAEVARAATAKLIGDEPSPERLQHAIDEAVRSRS